MKTKIENFIKYNLNGSEEYLPEVALQKSISESDPVIWQEIHLMKKKGYGNY